MEDGNYRTKAGSTVKLSRNGGVADAEFDWLEEDNACIDCTVDPYPSDGFLTWGCEYCGGGSAELMRDK